jgi:hypothetical protein
LDSNSCNSRKSVNTIKDKYLHFGNLGLAILVSILGGTFVGLACYWGIDAYGHEGLTDLIEELGILEWKRAVSHEKLRVGVLEYEFPWFAWLTMNFTVALVFGGWWATRIALLAHCLCTKCGYVLAGLTSERCPECGARIPKISGHVLAHSSTREAKRESKRGSKRVSG